MQHRILVLPQGKELFAAAGDNLLQILRAAGLAPDAPCGGNGSCGKCRVLVDGKEAMSCKTTILRDMTVMLPTPATPVILTEGVDTHEIPGQQGGIALAVDIGTTTVAGYLLDTQGRELARDSAANPQASFGADVISRIDHALKGNMEPMSVMIRQCLQQLCLRLCQQAGVEAEQISIVSIVGNPAMQQLFLGIAPENLARIPFTPVLKQMQFVPAADYIPACRQARLLIVPDISGFVGADAVAAALATELDRQEQISLLLDIGTNAEMILGSCDRLVGCSAAAGPALEGAGITMGMRGQEGAIDHVRVVDGKISCSVIGGGEAVGICGSGLIDAVAVALNTGLINERGRILDPSRQIRLTDKVYLTQDDIRQVQLAKGAIAAGIELLAAQLGIAVSDIQKVRLAGAFGTFMDPASACRIGLLPPILESRIESVGNAAGSGAKLLTGNDACRQRAQALSDRVEFVELASVTGFQRSFAQNMSFDTAEEYWIERARAVGFTQAVALDVSKLEPRQDVRDMCRADLCRAYGKNWTCPPYCGTMEECRQKMRQYDRGILLQTVGYTRKRIDTAAYRSTEQTHLQQFYRLAEEVRAVYPQALCLGAGGCRICGECAYPKPCRFPQKACASMEAYGLFVTQVCRDNDCQYHHGENTITFTSCILFF